MAWIYLAGSEGLQKHSKDTSAPLPTVKTTDTPKVFFCQECGPAICHGLRLPTTCPACEGRTSYSPSTLSTADFPAKTFPLQAAEQVWTESEVDYFSRSFGLSATYDLVSSSWRTSQRLLFEEANELLENFAASGMTVDGEFYPLRMWARITDANDGGFWRTPDTGAGGTSGLLKQGKTHRKSGAAITMRLVDQVNNPRMWPTPRAGKTSSENPEVWNIRKEAGNVSTPPLAMAVKMYPTPAANPSRGLRHGDPNDKNRIRLEPIGGSLNPTWVEWLMGYPCGWTALEDWAIQWFRPKRVKRSKG